jgi:transposase-like protein
LCVKRRGRILLRKIEKLREEGRPMVQVRGLTELRVKDLWKEVKDEDQWWGDLKEEMVRGLKALLETHMEAEIGEQLQAWKYGHVASRLGYRNGYRERTLLTEFGLIECLRVPRDREGCYRPSLLKAYSTRQDKVDGLVREAYLGGVSMRRVGEVLEPVLGDKVSPQTVSRIVSSLDREVERYHRRPLKDTYLYLFFDGITLKVKSVVGVKKRLVLCAYGITPQGKRELISFRQATAESDLQWEAFLRNIYDRGLEGKNLRLIVTDGCAGLHQALTTIYPYIPRQRCWAHKLRNVAAKLPRRVQEECLYGAKMVYLARTEREARSRFLDWAHLWGSTAPRAVACLEKDLEELLTFLHSPSDHWKKIRTTNVIERAFREVRRRTRPMTCFQNAASVDRMIYGVISHLNHQWEEKPLKEFTHNS